MVTYMSPPCIYLRAIAFSSHPPQSLLPHLCGLKNLSFPLGPAAGWQLNLTLLSSFSNLDISIQHSVLRFSDLDPSDHMDEHHSSDGEDGEMIETSNGKELVAHEGNSEMEPHEAMEFESEEAAKVFYDTYATHLGFIMRVDAFRRSMRDGKVVWRRLVCNKEGFRKFRPRRSENRKPRAITREGCKAMIVVKKEKTGKWVVTRFVKEHNHPLVPTPANSRRTVLLSQTPDEKDIKIRELTAELQRERKRSAAFQEQLDMVLRDMEEHSNHLSRNIDGIIESVREIESKKIAHSHS